MYIRTPKKYQGVQRRSVIPCRRIVLWFLALLVIGFGVGIYQNRTMFTPIVSEAVNSMVDTMEESVATITAPTPTPTPDPTNQIAQADTFWSQGAVEQAVRLYQEIIDSVPNDVTIYFRVAQGLIIGGQVEEALDYAEQAVTANPFSSDAWAIRAWALDWNDRPGEAISSALHALELNPQNARAMAYLSEAYFSAGQTQRALSTAEDALELDPDSPEAYRARGLATWYGLFDIETALVDFRTGYDIARDTSPANMVFLANDISDIEYSRQNYTEAIDILEGVLEVNPQNTQALFRMGRIYNSGLGDPSQAAGYLARCIDFNPESIGCHYLLGRTQETLENTTAAAESFERAIELGSTFARHYYWAGWTQIQLGNCNRAMTFLDAGYELAIEEGNSQLVSDFDTVIQICRPGSASSPPTPAAPLPDPPQDENADA